MKKRLTALLLCLGMLPLPACGAAAMDTPAPSPAFSDVPADAWYAQGVEYCRTAGILEGTGPDRFSPEDSMTRAMLAAVLYRVSGSPAVSAPPDFTDAESGSWYSDAVSWAAGEGILSGYGNGLFGVGDPVTREQAAVILWRYGGRPAGGGGELLTDAGDVSPWARDAVEWARGAGLLEDMTPLRRFAPRTDIKRGEIAAMLHRYLTGAGPEEAPENRILVAYFSATGATEDLAERMAEHLSADLYEILPEDPYTQADLAYYTDGRADREQGDPTARPAIAGDLPDLEGWDVLLLGYPIWHGQAPRIISTFLDAVDLAGKVVVPFCTSHSSGIGSSDTALHPLAPEADWRAGRRFPAGAGREAVEAWLDGLDLPRQPSGPAGEGPLTLTVGDAVFPVELEDNPTARALMERLPLTVAMSELNGNEKFYYLPDQLPTDPERPGTIRAGDLMLYGSDCLVLFYESFPTSYAYTRLGRVTEVEGLARALGGGSVEVSFQIKPEESPAPPVFDFEARTVTLNSGYAMPLNGLGTYSLTGETCVASVTAALERGVRLIDTAYMYHNEAEVGRAIRASGVPREEIFVITKLYPGAQYEDPEGAIQDALDKLDLGYIDLMLLHHPGENDVAAYRAMERAVEEGKIRSIGLSNWYVEELEAFLPQVTITPALVQNEIHPYYQENDVIPYIQSLGIVTQGWYPLGGRGHTAALLGDETISAIAAAHGKSSAQVILRWNLQKGVVVIPGSSNPDHIQENTELYDFVLTDQEMAQINALDRGEKHDWY